MLLRGGLGTTSVPSKVYSVLAAGRPVLASVDQDSEVARLLADSGAGRAVDPDDGDAFAAAVSEMVADTDALREMGRRGRDHAEQSAGPRDVADRYLELFQKLAVRQ